MKNLENEYKKQIDSEAPDLWARIEAGVDAYEESKKVSSESAPVSDKKDNITFFNKYKNTFTKIIVAAACVTLVVVAVKGGVLRNFGGKKSAAAETAMAETAMETTEAAVDDYSYEENSMSEAPSEETSEAKSEPMVNADTQSDKAAKDGDKELTGLKVPPTLSIDEEESLAAALKELGFENISKLQAEELSEVDITTARDLLPQDEEGFMASFVNNDNNQKCIVLYSFDITDLTVEIYMVKPANADDSVLYLK